MVQKITSTALIKSLEIQEALERQPCLLYVSGMEAGRLLPLNFDRGPIVIGRTDDNDVVLDEPEISRHHAQIDCRSDGRLFITDLGSKNGTFINGTRVDQADINADDKLGFGHFVLKLTFQDEEEIRFARQLYERAVNDPLTGIVNRQFFISTLEREWAFATRHNQRIAVAMLDIDHFKRINDAHGHLVGDDVLREFVRRLQRNTRLEDIIGRYGGEEFILLLRDTDQLGAMAVAERVRRAVAAEPFRTDEAAIPVTVSIGVSYFTAQRVRERRPLDIIHEADQALYQAKNGGRNRVIGCPAIGGESH